MIESLTCIHVWMHQRWLVQSPAWIPALSSYCSEWRRWPSKGRSACVIPELRAHIHTLQLRICLQFTWMDFKMNNKVVGFKNNRHVLIQGEKRQARQQLISLNAFNTFSNSFWTCRKLDLSWNIFFPLSLYSFGLTLHKPITILPLCAASPANAHSKSAKNLYLPIHLNLQQLKQLFPTQPDHNILKGALIYASNIIYD